ncbi:MAG TPA: copper resistance protein CopC [Nitrososphaeraceae archaeon]|nr:copper resistance protein CopC [Nitrososphaeraceae archaeon]
MSRHFARPYYHHVSSSIMVVAVFSILMSISLPYIPESYAHAFVINSNPSSSQTLKSPPTKVEVYLSEPVDLRYSKLNVIGPDGKQIDIKNVQYANGDEAALSVTLSPDIKDGIYTVSIKMLSQIDGHVTDNAFVFGVGEAVVPNSISSERLQQSSGSSSQLSILDAIARFPALVGQVMIVGAAFGTLWLWKPVSKINWLKSAFAQTRNRVDRSLVRLIVIGSVILVVSDFGMIYVQAYSINTGIADAIATKFGTIWIARTVESFVILAIAAVVYLKLKKTSSAIPSKYDILTMIVVGIAILVTTTLIGHSAAIGNTIPITIDFIHNLAASIWIGSVIYLAFVVVPEIKQAPLDEYVKASAVSIIIPRFSTITVLILGIIVITGPFLLYILENNIFLTLASLYGKALIAKLVLAAVMISIGGYNQIVIHRQALKVAAIAMSTSSSTLLTRNLGSRKISPMKRRQGAAQQTANNNHNELPSSSSSPSNSYRPYNSHKNAVSKLNTSTKVEAIIGILLLAAVAVLVNTGLPASEFQSQQQQQLQQQIQTQAKTLPSENIKYQTFTKFVENGSRVRLIIEPFTPGNNNFKISFLNQNRNLLDIKSVKMKLTQIEQGIGPIEVETKKISKGIFSANAAFGLSGEWNVLVEAFQNKPNSLNIVATYNLFVKPNLDQIKFNVKEFRIPGNNSQPLYPLYDNSRNVIWVGDTVIDSSRIFEFNLNSNKFTEHDINDTSIVTVMALDHNNQLWYADPLMRHLGQYDPNTHTNQIYKIPSPNFILSGMAIDRSDNVWLTSTSTNNILRFNTQAQKFTTFQLPTTNTTALAITIDPLDQIWIAEGIGKIANIDPTNNFNVTEYSPKGKNNTLASPMALVADPITGDIYISEYDSHTVSVFNPITKTFKEYPPFNSNGLPLGMALDSNTNLWIAENTINKIATIDPHTGEYKEITVPSPNPSIQWLTSDFRGNIWFAEQGGNALGVITFNANPLQSGSPVTTAATTSLSNKSQSNIGDNDFIPQYGFNYTDIVGPAVATGIIASALFYTKSITDLRSSLKQVNKGVNSKH